VVHVVHVNSLHISIWVPATVCLSFFIQPPAQAAKPPLQNFSAAASCTSCVVPQPVQLQLPYSGVEAWATKVFNPQTNVLTSVILLGDGTVADRKKLLSNEYVARITQFGKLHPRLFNKLSTIADTDEVDVHIWTPTPIHHPRREDLISNKAASSAFQATVSAAIAANAAPIVSWLQTNGITTFTTGTLTPFVGAHLTKSQISQLAATSLVSLIDIGLSPHPNQSNPPAGCGPYNPTNAWYSTINVDAARNLSPGHASTLLACIADEGTPNDASLLRMFEERFPGMLLSSHTQAVAGIISNTAGNNTGVTDAQIISTSSNTYVGYAYPDTGMYEYCFDEGTDLGANPTPVINVSLQFGTTADPNASFNTDSSTNPNLMPADQQADFLAQLPPYPLFVMAAGDTVGSVPIPYVVNKAFNALIVGASDDKGTASIYDDTIASFSSYVNPQVTSTDYELPHLVAPGVGIASANMIDLTTGLIQSTQCPGSLDGTSFSAPETTGVALLVISADPDGYYGWPEMVKTTLIATATHNVDGPKFAYLQPGPIEERKDGVGTLDAAAAVNLAQAQYLTPPENSSPQPRGRWAQTLTLPLPENSRNRTWNLAAETTGYMRVVIAWDSTSSGCHFGGGAEDNTSGISLYPFLDCLADDIVDGDLDLLVLDSAGNGVCISQSFDSNWEACDFPVVAGQTYTAWVSAPSFNVNSTVMSIAWNNYAVGSSAPLPISRSASIALGVLLLFAGVLVIRRRGMTQRRVLGWVLVIVCSFMTSCRSDGGSPLMAFGGNDGSIEVASSSVDVAGLPGLEGDGGNAAVTELDAGLDAGLCIGVVGTPEEIASTPRADVAVELAALKVDSSLVVARQSTYDRILADVTAIRATAGFAAGSDSLYPPPVYMNGKVLSLTLDSDALASAKAGTYTAWDCLNDYYGLTSIYVPSPPVIGSAVILSLKGNYNLTLLAGLYGSLPGVVSTDVFAGTGPESSPPEGTAEILMCIGEANGLYQYAIMATSTICMLPGCSAYYCYESTMAGVVKAIDDGDVGVDGGQTQCVDLFNQLCSQYPQLGAN